MKTSHLWTWVSLKPGGQSWSNFICSITGVGERLHKVLGQVLKNSHRLIMGKWCLHASSFIFDRTIIKVAGNQDRHKSSDKFCFGPLVSMPHLYVFWNEIWPWHIGLRWAIVALWVCCVQAYIIFPRILFDEILLLKIEYEPRHEKTCLWRCATRYDSNRPALLQ